MFCILVVAVVLLSPARALAACADLARAVLPATTVTRKYSQLEAIANDVDDARVLGGIHWRYDQVAGSALGRAVATEVVKDRLRAVHP